MDLRHGATLLMGWLTSQHGCPWYALALSPAFVVNSSPTYDWSISLGWCWLHFDVIRWLSTVICTYPGYHVGRVRVAMVALLYPLFRILRLCDDVVHSCDPTLSNATLTTLGFIYISLFDALRDSPQHPVFFWYIHIYMYMTLAIQGHMDRDTPLIKYMCIFIYLIILLRAYYNKHDLRFTRSYGSRHSII